MPERPRDHADVAMSQADQVIDGARDSRGVVQRDPVTSRRALVEPYNADAGAQERRQMGLPFN